jgi:hypothetical protein
MSDADELELTASWRRMPSIFSVSTNITGSVLLHA